MNLLLDTHAFIWMDSDAKRLSDHVANLLRNGENTLYLSLASVWEMQIKQQLGKLTLAKPLAEIISDQQKDNGVRLLSLSLEYILALSALPHHHKDPFDRLLIAQAKQEDWPLISHDPRLADYDIQVIW